MKTKWALAALFCLAAVVLGGQAADEPKKAVKEGGDEKIAGLERFKSLAGEWIGKKSESGEKKGEAAVTYKVTSGGTAVMEMIDPGGDHEMVTMIHQDGTDLSLTHYCMIGNQPHMKADAKGDGNKFDFKFVGASNMKSEKDPHMHSVVYTLVDKDTLKADWTFYNNGKEEQTMTFELKRKK
jgi:hypothetical protein